MGGAPLRLSLLFLAALLSPGCADVPRERARVLVTSGFTDQVFVLDAESGEITDSLLLDRRPGERDEPHGVAVSPDGQHFYVTLAHGEASLWKYETRDLRLVGRLTLTTNGASRVRLSPDGEVAAIPDYCLSGGGEVSRVAFVRTRDLTVIEAPLVCPAPHDAAFSPDGMYVAVPCTGNGELVILNAADFTEERRLPLQPKGRPMNAAWASDGQPLLVTLADQAEVASLDAAAGLMGQEAGVPTGGGAAQIEFAGDRAVVAHRGTGRVSIIEYGAGHAAEPPEVHAIESPGAHPHGVAVSRDGRVAYVTYEGDTDTLGGVFAIDLERRAILWHTPVGVFTLGVAVLPG